MFEEKLKKRALEKNWDAQLTQLRWEAIFKITHLFYYFRIF
jgi:hypothetical protein